MSGLMERKHARRWLSMAMMAGVIMGWVASEALRPRPAGAQQVLPDSAAQRYDMVGELKSVNARLASIEAYLRSGELNVVVHEPEKKSAAKPGR